MKWWRTMLLDEDRGKQLLERYRIPRPKGVAVQPDGMSAAYKVLSERPHPPFPLIVKVLGSDLAHKTERGAVMGPVKDEYQLVHALRDIRYAFPHHGVLVEEFIPHTIEFIVGLKKDETFGWVVMFGAGGVTTELYEDVAFRCLPMDEGEVMRMIRSTKVGRLFDGYRGMEIDPGPLVDAILGLQELVEENEDYVGTVEVNPLAWTEGCVVALDAKVDMDAEHSVEASNNEGRRETAYGRDEGSVS